MLRFIHISDTHLGPTPDYTRYQRNTLAYAQRLVDFLNADLDFTPDFVVHTGDVIDYPDPAAAQLAADLFRQLKYPIYYVVGNHDDPSLLRQYLMGQAPSDERLFYDFQRDDFHFLVLDTRGQPDPQGYVSPDQLEWLTETCRASTAQSLVILLHHLPVRMHVPWYDRGMEITNSDALFAALQPYRDRLRGLYFGHIHRALMGFRDGIVCSATNSSFMQFRVGPHDPEPIFDLTAPVGYSLVTLTHQAAVVTHHTIPFEKGASAWALIS